MAQKTHPKGFRLGITRNYSTKWFTKNSKKYAQFIFQDVCIRQYLARVFPNVIDILIERQPKIQSAFSNVKDQCVVSVILHETDNLTFFSPYARQILKNQNSSKMMKRIQSSTTASKVLEDLSNELPFSENLKLIIEVDRTVGSSQAIALEIQNALFIAQKRNNIRFQPILKQIKQNILKNKSVQGFRIELSGRSTGSLMAGQEYITHGKMPRQTIRVPIDYSAFDYPTKIGQVGVKIWVH